MNLTAILLTTLAAAGLAIAAVAAVPASLAQRQTCAVPGLGCYSSRDCCGGLTCRFGGRSCCLDGDDRCGCCR